jgi:hypothetical protein
LAVGFWLIRLTALLTFLWFKRSWHSWNLATFISSSFVVDVATILRTKNVSRIYWLKDFTAFFTCSWLYWNASVAAAVAALRTAKAMV